MSIKRFLLVFNLVILFSFVFNQVSYSQDNWWRDKKYRTDTKRQKFANCKKVFVDIAEGINYSNVYMIVPYFGTEVYLSIMSDDKGYYSPEQTKFILDNFFTNNTINSFKWKISSRSESYAFATGKYKYSKDGFVNSYDFSVSLKYINDTWLIDQIIIN